MAVPRSPLSNAKLLVTMAARSATNSDQAMSRSYAWPSSSRAQWLDPLWGRRASGPPRSRREGLAPPLADGAGRAGRGLARVGFADRATKPGPGTFLPPERSRARSPQTADVRAPTRPQSAIVETRTLPEQPVEKNPSRDTLHDGGEGEDRLHQRVEEERHLRPFPTGCRVSVGAVRTPIGADNRSRLAPAGNHFVLLSGLDVNDDFAADRP